MDIARATDGTFTKGDEARFAGDVWLRSTVATEDGTVKVVYTLTSPACPLGPVIDGQIHDVLTDLPGVKEVVTEMTLTPPWDPRTMASDDVKMQLGIW